MSHDKSPEPDADAAFSREDLECARDLARRIAEAVDYAKAHGYHGAGLWLAEALAEAERLAAQGGPGILLN